MHKEIGQVLYLNKSNGDYIPFYLEIQKNDCNGILPILNDAD